MKVVYLLDWYLFYVTQLANAMAAEHEVLVVSRDHNYEVSSPDSPMSLDEYMAAALSERVRRDRLRYRRGDPRGLLEVARLQRLIESWGADVIHAQETVDWRIALLAVLNKTRKRRVVLTVHDVENHPGERRGWQGRLYEMMVRSADQIIVHGEALRTQFLRVAGQRCPADVVSVPHGVFSLYRAWDDPTIDEEPHTVLFFGRIAPYKGLEDLIAAQPMVTAAVPQARFVIAGNGPFEPYRSLIRDPGAYEIHNRFISNREIPRLFRRAAVVVLPYVEASQSGVIPIAYEFGKPVIATRVGSLPEVVEDGASGVIVEPRHPEELAAAIVSVLKDAEWRNRLAEGAQCAGRTRLSWNTIAAETARVYAGIAG
jgi:glycosyltransferase involved in cell wall biosynthesis